MAELPPPNRTPRGVGGMRVHFIEEYDVASWCPTPDGSGPPEQVHVLFRIKGHPTPLVMRLKTQEATDTLIAALQRHRRDVWGPEA